MEDIKLVVTLVGLIVAVASFLIARHKDKEALIERIVKIEGRAYDLGEKLEVSTEHTEQHIQDVEKELIRRLVLVEANTSNIPGLVTKVDLFWGLVEEAMPRMLMKHDDMGRDVLLAKMENKTLTPEEAVQLKAMLEVDLVHMEADDKFKQLVIRFVIKRADLIARRIK